MNELSLFTGGGGGLLGTHLLGYEPIGYVEINDYCQRVIKQRIIDGYLRRAPIFSDIRTFVSEGYAESYKGMVDLVSAGFPCQPYSVAGKRQGENDERNMWPSTRDVIEIVAPPKILLENVPGLLSAGCGFDANGETGEELDHRPNGLVGYFGTILRDLAALGYDANWRVLSAAEMGAPHKRDRIFILADPKRIGRDGRKSLTEETGRNEFAHRYNEFPDPNMRRRGQLDTTAEPKRTGQPAGRTTAERGTSWWTTEPDVGRVANGVASRVDRLRALGNGQVPIVVKTVYELLGEID